MLKHDEADTQQRFQKLDAYYSQHVLSNDREEICRHASACRASTKHCFTYGLAPHVGRNFSLLDDGQPLRIMVLGLDWGEGEHQSVPGRRADFDDIGRRARRDGRDGLKVSDHLGGTEQAVRRLLGMPEGIEPDTRTLRLENGGANVYQCFAMGNRTICSATQGAESKTPDSMRTNCGGHIRRMIEILEPTHLVLQGAGASDYLRWLMPEVVDLEGEAPGASAQLTPYGVALGFWHPSARGGMGWGCGESTYYQDVVAPTLSAYRRTPWEMGTPRRRHRIAAAAALTVANWIGATPEYLDLVPRVSAGARWRFGPEDVAPDKELAITAAAALAQERADGRAPRTEGGPSELLIAREFASDPGSAISTARDTARAILDSADGNAKVVALEPQLATKLVWRHDDLHHLLSRTRTSGQTM